MHITRQRRVGARFGAGAGRCGGPGLVGAAFRGAPNSLSASTNNLSISASVESGSAASHPAVSGCGARRSGGGRLSEGWGFSRSTPSEAFTGIGAA